MMFGNLATYAEQQKKRGRKTDPRTMKRAIQAFSPYRAEVVTVLVAIFVTTLLGLVPALLISHVFDDAISKGDGTLLLIYAGIMATALILSGMIDEFVIAFRAAEKWRDLATFCSRSIAKSVSLYYKPDTALLQFRCRSTAIPQSTDAVKYY